MTSRDVAPPPIDHSLLAEQMMVGDDAEAPKYLHVMRWRSLSNWTALSGSAEFH